ncbi:MAG: C1 family peptidase [Polyangiales bacterium]
MLRASGVVDEASAYAVLLRLPSLALLPDFQPPRLAFAVASALPQARSSAIARASMTGLPRFPFGAAAPAGATSTAAPTSTNLNAAIAPVPGLPNHAIDLRPSQWPVRFQGDRGTCVAFSVTACVEQAEASGGTLPDLSEQFLFCKGRGYSGLSPAEDGMWLDNARKALTNDGICDEVLAPYQETIAANDPAQCGSISTSATSAALSRRRSPSLYATPNGGAAALVSQHLLLGSCVAVSLPVFTDPANPDANNWNTVYEFGLVINPLPNMTQVDGHAVCICGFAPDANAPGGGWFILRNSWDTLFGKLLPASNYVGPEPGYGQVSASYVDHYAWEVCGL